MTKFTHNLIQAIFLILTFAVADGWAAEPTLARLSFWIRPERMGDFERMYEKDLLPILQTHGLTPSSRQGRATPDSVFSRLFEIKTPSEVTAQSRLLHRDTIWTQVLRKAGTTFGIANEDSLLQTIWRRSEKRQKISDPYGSTHVITQS